MKMLVQRTPTTTAAPFNLLDLKAHVRVDADCELPSLELMGMAAALELEEFAQIALLTQTVRVTVFGPCPNSSVFELPIGPALDGATATVLIDGAAFADFEFATGPRPHVRWLAPFLELNPERISIEYQAGFGPTHWHIPKDLSLAVLDQTAMLFDERAPSNARGNFMSPHMARIGAKYRGVKL